MAEMQTAFETTNSWDWREIANVGVKDGSLQLTFGPSVICFVVVAAVALLLWRVIISQRGLRRFEVVEAELNIADIGRVTLRPNDEIVRIAYQAWVELSTRKVGLPFDENHDVISEIYSSWYDAFARLRDLAKTIPCHQFRDSKDTRELVDVMVRVLNDGLRPHLTMWQAKFRRWYTTECQKKENTSDSPQTIQRRFPEYKALVADLVRIQSQIVQYRNFLWSVAKGGK